MIRVKAVFDIYCDCCETSQDHSLSGGEGTVEIDLSRIAVDPVAAAGLVLDVFRERSAAELGKQLGVMVEHNRRFRKK